MRQKRHKEIGKKIVYQFQKEIQVAKIVKVKMNVVDRYEIYLGSRKICGYFRKVYEKSLGGNKYNIKFLNYFILRTLMLSNSKRLLIMY